jgi:hypothetical protein
MIVGSQTVGHLDGSPQGIHQLSGGRAMSGSGRGMNEEHGSICGISRIASMQVHLCACQATNVHFHKAALPHYNNVRRRCRISGHAVAGGDARYSASVEEKSVHGRALRLFAANHIGREGSAGEALHEPQRVAYERCCDFNLPVVMCCKMEREREREFRPRSRLNLTESFMTCAFQG